MLAFFRILIGLTSLLGSSQIGMFGVMAYLNKRYGESAEGYIIGHCLLRGAHHYYMITEAQPEYATTWPMKADFLVKVPNFDNCPIGAKITFTHTGTMSGRNGATPAPFGHVKPKKN